uniref:Uncharacterized protein n=1 Tax=Romanomermis culicivorax TaxID=13658 RepID=A0A915HLY3_ROMCU
MHTPTGYKTMRNTMAPMSSRILSDSSFINPNLKMASVKSVLMVKWCNGLMFTVELGLIVQPGQWAFYASIFLLKFTPYTSQ